MSLHKDKRTLAAFLLTVHLSSSVLQPAGWSSPEPAPLGDQHTSPSYASSDPQDWLFW